MHDITQLESLGIAAVFIASEPFRDAAAVQAKALGSQPEGVFVRHPIQDRTDDELAELADQALEAVLRALTAEQP